MKSRKYTKRFLSTLLPVMLLLGGCADKEAAVSSAQTQEIKQMALDTVKDLTVEYGKDDEADAVTLLKKTLTGTETSEETTENNTDDTTENTDDSSKKEKEDDTITVDGRKVTISADPAVIDTTVLGTTSVTYTFAYGDGNTSQKQEKKINITVQDTQAPIIHASHQYEVRIGQTFYPEKVIAEVIDPVDGPLKLVQSEPAKIEDKGDGVVYSEGWYTVDYSVNTWRAGTYSMHIHAVDKHGLSTDDSAINIIVNSRYWSDSRYTYEPETEETEESSDNDEENTETAEPEQTEQPEVTVEPEQPTQPSEPQQPAQPDTPSDNGESTDTSGDQSAQ